MQHPDADHVRNLFPIISKADFRVFSIVLFSIRCSGLLPVFCRVCPRRLIQDMDKLRYRLKVADNRLVVVKNDSQPFQIIRIDRISASILYFSENLFPSNSMYFAIPPANIILYIYSKLANTKKHPFLTGV